MIYAYSKLQKTEKGNRSNWYRIKMRKKVLKVLIKEKEEHYCPVSRLSDTRYSANGTKGKWRYKAAKRD